MNGGQKKIFGEGLINLANIIAGALVFGQFVSGDGFQVAALLLGLLFSLVFYLWAYVLSRGIDDAQTS